MNLKPSYNTGMKFNVNCYKKDGTLMKTLKIKDGRFVEPIKPDDLEQFKKDGGMLYPGTQIPNEYMKKAKQLDVHKMCGGAPPPWAKPETVTFNEELFATEGLYEKLEQAKVDGNQELIDKYSAPLIRWFCPIDMRMKCVYASAKQISNRNDRSDFILDNLDRFEQAIEKIKNIYITDRVSTIRGMAALQNLLSAKFQFRVGNNEDNPKTGTGVTTFQPKHLEFKDDVLHFVFIGKKHVRWHKKLKPENELEQMMFDDLKMLSQKDNKYIFTLCGERINSGDANILLRQCFGTTKQEEKYLSFHAYRHRAVSKLLKEFVETKLDKKLKRGFNKIESGRSKKKDLKKAQFIQKQLKEFIIKEACPALNDTFGPVFSTYAGGKLFKQVYEKYDIEYDEKKRTFVKTQFEEAKDDDN
jgi:hypothetical protein